MEKLADVATETDLGDLDDVVPAQVEALQVGRVAESALRQAPDAVVGQVEPLELVEVAQGLGLQLHRHAARPLRVVTREQGVPLFEIVSKPEAVSDSQISDVGLSQGPRARCLPRAGRDWTEWRAAASGRRTGGQNFAVPRFNVVPHTLLLTSLVLLF